MFSIFNKFGLLYNGSRRVFLPNLLQIIFTMRICFTCNFRRIVLVEFPQAIIAYIK